MTQETSNMTKFFMREPDECPECKGRDRTNVRPGIQNNVHVILQKCSNCGEVWTIPEPQPHQ